MRVIRVDDPDDPRLEDYTRLTDVVLRRKTEPAGGLYIAESTKVVERAIGAGHAPRSVLLQERWLAEMTPLIERFDVSVFIGEPEVLERLTGFVMHRGALASMHRPVLRPVAEVIRGARRVVIIEDVVDHTNVGAILRNCAGLGVDAVLVTPRCADPLYRRSVRVSMGTVFQIPWTRIPDLDDGGADPLRAAGFRVAAFGLGDDAVSLDDYRTALPDRLALVFGTEGAGLLPSSLAAADDVVMIPMSGGVDSLNVASATGIAIWATRP